MEHCRHIEYLVQVLINLCCFFTRAIEEFVRRYPQHANFKRPVDNHVALHIAAVNNRFDVVSFLAQMVVLHVFCVEVNWGFVINFLMHVFSV